MSISKISDKTVSIPSMVFSHRYIRNFVEHGLARLNQSDSITQRVAKYYSDYFADCTFYDPFDENRKPETRCSVSGKDTVLGYVCHNVPLITRFPGPGLYICLEKNNDKIRDVVSSFFKKLHHDMGPYPCYIKGPVVNTIREDIPDVNIPNSQEKHSLFEIAVDYRQKDLRIICEVWNKGITQDYPLSSLIRSNRS
jgi:hypothetical protein